MRSRTSRLLSPPRLAPFTVSSSSARDQAGALVLGRRARLDRRQSVHPARLHEAALARLGADAVDPRRHREDARLSASKPVALGGARVMLITRSPLRITLGGGGTDLPSYYREHGGFLIAAAIDKYVYVTVMRPFTPGIFLKYSKLEHVDAVDEVAASDHPRGDQADRLQGRRSSRSPRWPTSRRAPASARRAASPRRCSRRCTRTGGSLLHPNELAELACEIEIDRLGEPIGKQDQYIAAYGGMTCFTFHAGRQRRGRAARAADRHAVQPRGQPAAVLHRLLAQRRRHPETRTTRRSRTTATMLDESALREGARPAQPRGARAGRHRARSAR